MIAVQRFDCHLQFRNHISVRDKSGYSISGSSRRHYWIPPWTQLNATSNWYKLCMLNVYTPTAMQIIRFGEKGT